MHPAHVGWRPLPEEAGTDFAMKQYYVYIMSSRSGTLYTGVTNDLARRVYEHKNKLIPGFTAKYNITKLVYFETTEDVRTAIAREKQIKGWLRVKKVALIESVNPSWDDLSADW
jgi:putative endonuclease